MLWYYLCAEGPYSRDTNQQDDSMPSNKLELSQKPSSLTSVGNQRNAPDARLQLPLSAHARKHTAQTADTDNQCDCVQIYWGVARARTYWILPDSATIELLS